MKKLLLFISLSTVTVSLDATTFVVPSDRQLIHHADAIVLGSALTSFSRLNEDDGIETVTPFSVTEVIRGSQVTSVIEVVEPGGIYGDRATIIAGVPQFFPGQRMLLFLKRRDSGSWAVEELVLGKFRFGSDSRGRNLLLRDAEEIVGWDSQLRRYSERARVAASFLDFVRNEAQGIRSAEDYFVADPAALHVQSSSGTTTTSAPAASAVAAAAFTATSYTMLISGNLGSRWAVFPSPVTFFTGTTSEPGAPGGGVTAVQTALAAWSNDCASNVNYQYGGTDTGGHTQGLHATDGANTVLFERDLSTWGVSPFSCSGSGYSGTLGIGGVTSASGSNAVNGESFVTTVEADVEMNRGLANCTLLFNNGDFNSAVTHEVGHTLGFRHSDQTRDSGAACSTDPSLECSSQAIMKSFIPTGLNAALQPWDQHAVQAVYPGGSCTTAGPPRRGDLNGDGISDIFWRNASTGADSIWFVNGSGFVSGATAPSVPSGTTIVGVGDFNHDGKADLLWRNGSGGISIWFMNGAALLGSVTLPTVSNTAVVVAGVGDLNGDGYADIIWRNTQTGDNSVWFITANGFTGGGNLPSVANLNLSIVSVADFNGDGKADLLWRNGSTGDNYIWLMSSTTIIGGSQLPTIGSPLQIAGTGDFDGDGTFDLLWRNTATGANYIWPIHNGAFNGGGPSLPSVSPGGAQITAVGDFNGDGAYDILWRDETTGANSIWFINGNGFYAGATLPSVAGSAVKIVSPMPR